MDFKEFLSKNRKEVNLDEILEATDLPPVMENSPSHGKMPPAVLMMRRVSVRQHSNGQSVALYHIDKLNKYVTVPYPGDHLQVVPEQYEFNLFFQSAKLPSNSNPLHV